MREMDGVLQGLGVGPLSHTHSRLPVSICSFPETAAPRTWAETWWRYPCGWSPLTGSREQTGIHQSADGRAACRPQKLLILKYQIMTATGTGGGQWRWPTFFLQTRSVPFVSPDSSHQPRSSGRLSDLWWQVLFLGDLFPFRFKQALNLSHWVCEFVTFIPRTQFRCYARAHFFGLWGFALLLRPTTFFFFLVYLQVLLIFFVFFQVHQENARARSGSRCQVHRKDGNISSRGWWRWIENFKYMKIGLKCSKITSLKTRKWKAGKCTTALQAWLAAWVGKSSLFYKLSSVLLSETYKRPSTSSHHHHHHHQALQLIMPECPPHAQNGQNEHKCAIRHSKSKLKHRV